MKKAILLSAVAAILGSCSGGNSGQQPSAPSGDTLSKSDVKVDTPAESGKKQIVYSFESVGVDNVFYKKIDGDKELDTTTRMMPLYSFYIYKMPFEARRESDSLVEIIKADFMMGYLDFKKTQETEYDDQFEYPVSNNGFVLACIDKFSDIGLDFSSFVITKSKKHYDVNESFNIDSASKQLVYKCLIGDSVVKKTEKYVPSETNLEYDCSLSDFRELWSYVSNVTDADGCSIRDEYGKFSEKVFGSGGSCSETRHSVDKIKRNGYYVLQRYDYEYSFGGAHGFTSESSLHIWDNGDTIKVYDVFDQGKEPELMEKLFGIYAEDYQLYEGFVDGGISQFAISDSCVTLSWGQYEVAPYSSGFCFMELPIEEYKKYFTPEFLSKIGWK